jgi:hypothetical protein
MTCSAMLAQTYVVRLRLSHTSQNVIQATLGRAKRKKGKSHNLILPL